VRETCYISAGLLIGLICESPVGRLSVVVSAVLEHEAIAGLSAGKPTGLRAQRGSRGSISEDRSKDMSLDMLIKAVGNWYFVFGSCHLYS